MVREAVLLLHSELQSRLSSGLTAAQLEQSAALSMVTADLRLSGLMVPSETAMESAMASLCLQRPLMLRMLLLCMVTPVLLLSWLFQLLPQLQPLLLTLLQLWWPMLLLLLLLQLLPMLQLQLLLLMLPQLLPMLQLQLLLPTLQLLPMLLLQLLMDTLDNMFTKCGHEINSLY